MTSGRIVDIDRRHHRLSYFPPAFYRHFKLQRICCVFKKLNTPRKLIKNEFSIELIDFYVKNSNCTVYSDCSELKMCFKII